MLFWYHCTRLGISQQDAVKKGEKKIVYSTRTWPSRHVFTTQHVKLLTCSWQWCSCFIISRQSPWRWGAKEGCIACKNYPLTFKFSRHIAYKQLNCTSLQVATLNRTERLATTPSEYPLFFTVYKLIRKMTHIIWTRLPVPFLVCTNRIF